jgi:phosphoglycolate phosphatase-like HAD superfamily hydrolase
MAATVERLILFDIDGTLLLSGPRVRALFAESFRAVFGLEPPLDGVHFAGMTDRGIVRRLLRRAGAGLVDGDAFAVGFARFAEDFARRMEEVYPGCEGPRLMPGVRSLLQALHADPSVVLLAATGNLPRTARVKLARFGLDHFLPHGAYGDAHEEREELFRHALELARRDLGWKGRAGEVWILGDTRDDVEAARAVGARILAVGTGVPPTEDLRPLAPDAWLADLGDTEAVLRILRS